MLTLTLASRCLGASIQNHWVPTAAVLIMRVAAYHKPRDLFISLALLPLYISWWTAIRWSGTTVETSWIFLST